MTLQGSLKPFFKKGKVVKTKSLQANIVESVGEVMMGYQCMRFSKKNRRILTRIEHVRSI